MNKDDYKTLEAMEKYGGSFIQALAICFHRADPMNFRKLKNAFEDYWRQYKNMANIN